MTQEVIDKTQDVIDKTRKLWSWIQYRGVAETSRAVGLRAAQIVKGPDLERRAEEAEAARSFDIRHNVDTDGRTPARAHRLSDPHDQDAAKEATEYLGIQEAPFKRILDLMKVDFTGYTFIDYGSGKGKALFLASEYPFEHIVGVELMPALHEIALRNFATYENPRSLCHDFTSLCLDAGSYEPPEGPLVCFFFNPFGPPVMTRVIDKLVDSVQRSPRPIYIVYGYPVFERMFTRAGFALIRREPGFRVLFRNH